MTVSLCHTIKKNIMSPKEKAQNLVYEFFESLNPSAPDDNIAYEKAKKCALISISQIIEGVYSADSNADEVVKYYQEVKEEIKSL